MDPLLSFGLIEQVFIYCGGSPEQLGPRIGPDGAARPGAASAGAWRDCQEAGDLQVEYARAALDPDRAWLCSAPGRRHLRAWPEGLGGRQHRFDRATDL